MNTALLVMDVQEGIVERLANSEQLIANVVSAIASARRYEVPTIFVRVAFRPGWPEVSDRNQSFTALTSTAGSTFDENNPATQIHRSLVPQPHEPIVTKRRVSAFAGSDLEVLLRAMNVTHLVLTGISTSGVVLSTLREAADRDFELTVIEDCCADHDDEVNRVLMTKVFPRQAIVESLADWSATLEAESN